MRPGTKRTLSFLSVLIIGGGIASFVISLIWLISTYRASGFAGAVMAIAIAASLASAVMAVLLGISTISFLSSIRGRKNRKILTDKKISYMRRAMIVIILSLIQIIFICITGAKTWQVISLLICSVVFPLFYLFFASTI